MEDSYQCYRPWVLKLVGAFLSRKTPVVFRATLLVAGITTLCLPSSLRERVLFRTRNADTRRIAKHMVGNFHIAPRD